MAGSGEGDRRFAGGTTDCDLDYYECGGLNITVAMYEAVLHGCTGRRWHRGFFGAFLCGTMEVTAAQRLLLCLEGAPRNAWVALSR